MIMPLALIQLCFIFTLLIEHGCGWTNLRAPWATGLGLEPGPLTQATTGQVWPKPQVIEYFDQYFTVEPKKFNFVVVGQTCDLLSQALNRYELILQSIGKQIRKNRKLLAPKKYKLRKSQILTELSVNLTAPCDELPHFLMDEQYGLYLKSPNHSSSSELQSASVWGILRGLESFIHLIYLSEDGLQLFVRSAEINDYPRFSHRGLHLDTARHYLPLRIIKIMLDGMAMNKMNVFHWHLVDDQSFPFESKIWPKLSTQGAYSPLHIYTQEDVADVIEYARLRGIRVIAEFDTPGHTRSWGNGYPELLTPCYDSLGAPDGSLGPINPISNFTYQFMDKFIQELIEVFPDHFLHLGGDEVPFDCWLSNPDIQRYINLKGLTPQQLEGEYIQQIMHMATTRNSTPIIWQEIFDNGVQLPGNAIVHVWKDWIDYRAEMANVTAAGLRALFSSCWYLDHLNTGGDWQKFYACDPSDFSGTVEAHKLVVGGEACMWAEVTDATNVLTRVWPRASAVAEKLWSAANVDSVDAAASRLEEHSCRMNLRGVPSQPPNGPGFCPFQLYN